MQNQESKNFKNPITNKVYYYLASILYDKCSIPWNELTPIALFLYQNFQYGPKGTKDLVLQLYRISSLVYKKNKAYPSLLHDEKGECISYGTMIGNQSTGAFHDVERLTNSMINNFNKAGVNQYIFYLKERMEKYVSLLETKNGIDSTMEETIQQAMLGLRKENASEDIFRQVKKIKILLNQNNKIKEQKELETRERIIESMSLPHEEAREIITNLCNDAINKPIINKSIPDDPIKEIIENFFIDETREDDFTKANAILKRLEILCANTPENDINKTILKIEIDDFQNDLRSENIEMIQREITRLEEVLNEQEQETMIRS